MNIVTGLAVYFLIWWTALFVVLPLGVRPAEKRDPGMAGGAPEDPGLKRKVILTSILSVIVWLVLYAGLRAGMMSFLQVSEDMVSEDIRH